MLLKFLKFLKFHVLVKGPFQFRHDKLRLVDNKSDY